VVREVRRRGARMVSRKRRDDREWEGQEGEVTGSRNGKRRW
jgi:hypothetical protein